MELSKEENLAAQVGQEEDPAQNGKALTALILGIASLVFIIIFQPIGLVLGIIGIVFGVIGRRAEQKTQAKAGLILSIFGTLINGILVLLLVIMFVMLIFVGKASSSLSYLNVHFYLL